LTRRIGVGERRARLGVRHHLAVPADDVVTVAGDLAGLHATDPATVMLSGAARLRSRRVADVERALYDDRTLVRLLGMRRTVFVVPVELVPVVQASSTQALVPVEWRRTLRFLEESGLDLGEEWLLGVEEATVAALRARGTASAAQLAADVPDLRTELVLARGTKNEATQRMTNRVLFLLAAKGRIVRGRPAGSWTSTQYQWAPIETWLPGGLPEMSVEEAQAELARRWLRTFGPGTAGDLKWWTGWPVRDVKRALAAVGAVEVALDGGSGLVLPGDLEPVPPPEPWVALLPSLDPTPMGWIERDWYLGEHRAPLFDRTGNIGPTVWSDGRIIGGWAQRKDGEVAVRLLEDVGSEVEAAVDKAAGELATVIGDVRVTPRFPTPVDRELRA